MSVSHISRMLESASSVERVQDTGGRGGAEEIEGAMHEEDERALMITG